MRPLEQRSDEPLPDFSGALHDAATERTLVHPVLSAMLTGIRERARRPADSVIAYYEDAPYAPE